MTNEYSCETCQDQLFDYVDNKLTTAAHVRAEQHMETCAECRATLSDIWNMQSTASHWRESAPSTWDRKQYFDSTPWHVQLQWVASFASIVVLVLVLGEARISTNDGLTIEFGRDYISQEQLSQQLVSLQEDQQRQMDTSVGKLTSQQITTNQLLLRSVLDTSRKERREELGTMLVLLEESQDQQTETTAESLRYLIASQLQDRKEIEDLNNALLQVNTDRNF